ncbi:hypothetical protein C100_16295 [Sphingobium sp. C100]|nr:hypothetical protein C100_16295 [Sphingobium sp. C100]
MTCLILGLPRLLEAFFHRLFFDVHVAQAMRYDFR